MNDRPLTVELVLSLPEACPCFFFVFHGMTHAQLDAMVAPSESGDYPSGGGEVYREALACYLAAQA